MTQGHRLGVGLCALLVAFYVAAPFCPAAKAQPRGCCDPAAPCGSDTGLTAPDCCRLDAGRPGSAAPASAVTLVPASPLGGSAVLAAGVSAPAAPAAVAPAALAIRSTGDPPPLYLLHASLLL